MSTPRKEGPNQSCLTAHASLGHVLSYHDMPGDHAPIGKDGTTRKRQRIRMVDFRFIFLNVCIQQDDVQGDFANENLLRAGVDRNESQNIS